MQSKSSALTRRAPAKINLRLEVLRKRADGYHEIRSLMCPVGLCDSVTVTPVQKDISLTADTKAIPLDATNLAYRAAALFAEKKGLQRGVAIHLEKKIPAGAGLGGGSSDAAAVLWLLNELSGSGCPTAALMELGALLGSDVPFFFCRGPALAEGRGDLLTAVSVVPPFWVVLVTPPFGVSTAWAYSCVVPSEGAAQPVTAERVDLRAAGASLLRNDLEAAVIGRYPELGAIKEFLCRQGAWGALMSGSGSTVYGIFFDPHEADETRQRVEVDFAHRHWKATAVPALAQEDARFPPAARE